MRVRPTTVPAGGTVQFGVGGAWPGSGIPSNVGKSWQVVSGPGTIDQYGRYTAPTDSGGGRVTVRVERQDGHARIAVLDEGPGVRPENLPRIFDPYFSTHDTGTGLGLPITRRIVEEHGGTIAAGDNPGGGTRIQFTLPLAAAARR